MLERLKAMLRKEFIQVLRDPRMRFIIFVIPIFQTVVFGYAVNTDVRDVKTAIYDLDNSPESRDLTSRFAGSGYFRIVEYINGEQRVGELMDRGTVKVVLRMNKGFGEDLRSDRDAPLQMILDGTDSNTAGIALTYAGRIAARFSERVRMEQAARAFGPAYRVGGVETASRAWFNENLESRNFYVPAVIANIVFIITMLLSSMAVVREKEIGTMEQLMVTPIRPVELMLGKMLPFAAVGLLDVALVTGAALVIFRIPFQGSVPMLLASAMLYVLTMLGAGLFISTISHTQQQAMMATTFFSLPAFMLSGFAFPIRNMPEVVQWVTYLNPLRYFMEIVRGVFLKGTGMETLWPQMLGLAVFGVAVMYLSAARFRKRLD